MGTIVLGTVSECLLLLLLVVVVVCFVVVSGGLVLFKTGCGISV